MIFCANSLFKIAARGRDLEFTNLDGIEYAFYKTKEKATTGFMRFQPYQVRDTKRAKLCDLVRRILFYL